MGRDCRIGTEGQKREVEVNQEDQSLYENIIMKPIALQANFKTIQTLNIEKNIGPLTCSTVFFPTQTVPFLSSQALNKQIKNGVIKDAHIHFSWALHAAGTVEAVQSINHSGSQEETDPSWNCSFWYTPAMEWPASPHLLPTPQHTWTPAIHLESVFSAIWPRISCPVNRDVKQAT